MRVFAISDLHIDFPENRAWLLVQSEQDYTDDILILAGDVADIPARQVEAFTALKKRFHEVLFVPGNHDLWVYRNDCGDSLARYTDLIEAASDCGIRTGPFHIDSLSIVPLTGWYDFSFGEPSESLLRQWMDFNACSWPDDFDETKITAHFLDLNELNLTSHKTFTITFSHFLPRIDLMPAFIPQEKRVVYPVLGTVHLETQIRQIGPDIHVYGHSHVNTRTMVDGIWYINNAFGYPYETRISRKSFFKLHEF